MQCGTILYCTVLHCSQTPTLTTPSIPSGEGQKSKKRVSWAEESNLVMIHYFEMDESERGGVGESGSMEGWNREGGSREVGGWGSGRMGVG